VEGWILLRQAHEDLGEWEEALKAQEKVSRLSSTPRSHVEAHLLTELGRSRVEGRLSLSPQSLSLEARADLHPFSLAASLGFAGGGLREARLSGSLAFDLPLYPLAWPELEVNLSGEPRALVVEGEGRRYLVVPGEGGRGVLRLPQGRYRLLAPEGYGFAQGEGLLPDLRVDLGPEGRRLALRLVPAVRLGLALSPCSLEARPGYVRGVPGVDLEASLGRFAVRLEGPVSARLVPGGWALLSPGEYRLRLEGPWARAAYLADRQGRPVEALRVREGGLLELCLAFPERPVEEQEVR
jgi:hypothetical protein